MPSDPVAGHPGLVAALAPEQMQLIADKAHANDTAAVLLMLDVGFDALIPGPDGFEAIRWAAFHGNPEMTRQLLKHDPPINVPDRSYGGTPLDNGIYGSLHGWSCDSAPCDYGATVRLLIEAGERVKPHYLPTGVDDVDAVLREYVDRNPPAGGRALRDIT